MRIWKLGILVTTDSGWGTSGYKYITYEQAAGQYNRRTWRERAGI